MLSLLLSHNFTMEQIFAEILAVLVIIFLILPFHEWAHAFIASLLGDKGIKQRGRLSLNPLSHIDPIGALFMLLIGFGWAKPVPVDPRYFKNPKAGMAITALMGPVANLVAALFGGLVLNGINTFAPTFLPLSYGGYLYYNNQIGMFVYYFLWFYITVNITLAVFNLIPIPPLDGSKILFAFLPDRTVNFFYQYQNVFFVGLFVLMYMGTFNGYIGKVSGFIQNGIMWLSSLPFLPFA